MNFLTGKHLPRRTFVQGMGASIALPLLDAMVPAGGRAGAEPERTRLIAIENSHGDAGCTAWGEQQNLWAPPTTGRDFDLGGTSMSSLTPFQDYLTIVSNTDVRMADAYQPHEVGGDHF